MRRNASLMRATGKIESTIGRRPLACMKASIAIISERVTELDPMIEIWR